MKTLLNVLLTTTLFFCGSGLLTASNCHAEHRVFKAITVLVGNTKVWLPSSFTVKKGDTVEFHLKTTLKKPSDVHGFSIPDFGISEVVTNKEKVIKLTADKAGIHEINCQLHAAHIGGQFIVLE